jgi:hypothetical protein
MPPSRGWRTVGAYEKGVPIDATRTTGASRQVSRSNRDSAQQTSPSRRQLFLLAGVLAATVLTAGAAIAGLTKTAEPLQPSPPTVSQIVGPAPTAPPRIEPGD